MLEWFWRLLRRRDDDWKASASRVSAAQVRATVRSEWTRGVDLPATRFPWPVDRRNLEDYE